MAKLHYRYVEVSTEYGVKVELRYFLELRETRCGYWLAEIYGFFMDEKSMEERQYDYQYYEDEKIWVSKTTLKRRAYPTKEQAYDNYVMRKRRQIRILTSQLQYAQRAALVAESNRVQLIQTGWAKESTKRVGFLRMESEL